MERAVRSPHPFFYASLSHFCMTLFLAAPASRLPFLSTALGRQESRCIFSKSLPWRHRQVVCPPCSRLCSRRFPAPTRRRSSRTAPTPQTRSASLLLPPFAPRGDSGCDAAAGPVFHSCLEAVRHFAAALGKLRHDLLL